MSVMRSPTAFLYPEDTLCSIFVPLLKVRNVFMWLARLYEYKRISEPEEKKLPDRSTGSALFAEVLIQQLVGFVN